jgi:hypothetical protein
LLSERTRPGFACRGLCLATSILTSVRAAGGAHLGPGGNGLDGTGAATGILGFALGRRLAWVDAEGLEAGAGRLERHPPLLLVVAPDSVVALGADLLDQALVEKALQDVASGIALSLEVIGNTHRSGRSQAAPRITS